MLVSDRTPRARATVWSCCLRPCSPCLLASSQWARALPSGAVLRCGLRPPPGKCAPSMQRHRTVYVRVARSHTAAMHGIHGRRAARARAAARAIRGVNARSSSPLPAAAAFSCCCRLICRDTRPERLPSSHTVLPGFGLCTKHFAQTQVTSSNRVSLARMIPCHRRLTLLNLSRPRMG